MRKLVYIAGPYTHPDPVVNTRIAIDAWDLLVVAEYTPYVPHASLLIHLIHPKPLEFWYEYDIEIMKRCDIVLRLPGASNGADGEVKAAKELGIPVFCGTVEEFLAQEEIR